MKEHPVKCDPHFRGLGLILIPINQTCDAPAADGDTMSEKAALHLDERWDKLIDLSFRRTVYGTLSGCAAAVLLFRECLARPGYDLNRDPTGVIRA